MSLRMREPRIDKEKRKKDAYPLPDLKKSPRSSVLGNKDFGLTLTQEMVKRSLRTLGLNGSGIGMTYLELHISRMNLVNIDIISTYVNLQVIDVSINYITDLKPLGNLPFLTSINAASNRIKELLNFKAPLRLREAIFFHNLIKTIPDLKDYADLRKLRLGLIAGLENCKSLDYLSLTGNHLVKIENLDFLNIRYLNLSQNKITSTKNLEKLFYLEELDLGENHISKLEGLEGHYFLKRINLTRNRLTDMNEILNLKTLSGLRELDLRKNPVRKENNYYVFILYHLTNLTFLDGNRISIRDRVAVKNRYSISMDVYCGKTHVVNAINCFLQQKKIRDSVMKFGDLPYEFYVLVGPCAGISQHKLLERIVSDFPDVLGIARLHTTNIPRSQNSNYELVTLSEFDELHKMGSFIFTADVLGERYGLTWDAIDDLAKEGKKCIAYMELECAVSLKLSIPSVEFVLVIPIDIDIHTVRLHNLELFQEDQINEILKRRRHYFIYHVENPGFFSAIINTDDLERAYQQLKILAEDWCRPPTLEVTENIRIAAHWKPQTTINKDNDFEINSLEFRRQKIRDALQKQRPKIVN